MRAVLVALALLVGTSASAKPAKKPVAHATKKKPATHKAAAKSKPKPTVKKRATEEKSEEPRLRPMP